MELIFWAHGRGEFEEKTFPTPVGQLTLSSRKHRLLFVYREGLSEGLLALPGTVNSDEFFGTHPELVLCSGVYITRTMIKYGPAWNEFVTLPYVWLDFVENASQSHNEYFVNFTEKPDGLSKTRIELHEAWPMGEVLEADDFRLRSTEEALRDYDEYRRQLGDEFLQDGNFWPQDQR